MKVDGSRELKVEFVFCNCCLMRRGIDDGVSLRLI